MYLESNVLRAIYITQMSEFKPKGEEAVRKELTEIMGEDVPSEKMDKLVERSLKDEKFKESLHTQKGKANKKANDYKKGKDYYKKGGKNNSSKEKNKKTSKEEDKVSQEDMEDRVYLRTKGFKKDDFRMMSQVRKIYKEEGKTISLEDASKTKLFKSMRDKDEERTKDKDAQMGGSGASGKTNDKKPKPKTEKEHEFVNAMRA